MKFLVVFILTISTLNSYAEESATERVKKSEMHTRGDSFYGESTMTVFKDKDSRSLSMMAWTKGTDKALVKITQPAKDKGVSNLRLDFNFWQYLPNINRIVKIPPSMMLQSWMGSDFTNDDLVKSSSLSRDYEHKVIKKGKLNGDDIITIECTPKKNAPVVWGKVELWLRLNDSVPLRQYYYSEKGDLIKVMAGENIKSYGKHSIPTKLTMVDAKNKTHKTVIEYVPSSIKFDTAIPDSVFTQTNLKKVE